jgi:hypothetical protein
VATHGTDPARVWFWTDPRDPSVGRDAAARFAVTGRVPGGQSTVDATLGSLTVTPSGA